jgi:hypothetical protein
MMKLRGSTLATAFMTLGSDGIVMQSVMPEDARNEQHVKIFYATIFYLQQIITVY